jgi:membrane protein
LRRLDEVLAYFRAPIGWATLGRRTIVALVDDDCFGLAAQLAFYFLLSLFPALLFLVALLAQFPVEAPLEQAIARLYTFLPGESVEIIRRHIQATREGSSGGLLTLSIAGAIWSSSAAMTAIITALNRAYDIREFRPWWKMRAVAIVLTIALALLVVGGLLLVAGGTGLVGWTGARLGLGRGFEYAWTVLQWPLAILAVVVAVNFVYYFAPNADTCWVWFTPGSIAATAIWMLISIGFRLYVQSVPSYGAVYGAIGGVIVLLTWLYLSGFALLLGAELNAEIDRMMPTRDTAPQRPDRKKKIGPVAEHAALSGLPDPHATH